MPLPSRKQPVRIWVFSLLFWLVGLSSWITITGLFAELSLMVKDLNEGFEIWSYITLIIQLANIGPLIYSIIPRKNKTQKFVVFNGYIIFSFSCVSMLIMSLFWDTQITIFGSKRSIILYITTFGTAICDCMTTIIFWIFVSYFPTQYMAILGAGESSSGIICAILIWIQQLNRPEDKPRYSVEIYLLCIALFLPVSAMSFTLLMRFLHNGYFENAKDWISMSKETDILTDSMSTYPNSMANNTLETNNNSNSFYQINTQSLSKNNSKTEMETEMETEMVQSNISTFITSNYKLNQLQNNYSSMKQTEPLTEDINNINNENENENDNIISTITLNTNQLNIIKNHFQNQNSYSKSNFMNTLYSEASTGITQNINTIILNNVSAGYWYWIIIISILSGIQNGMMPSISSYSLLPYGDIAYIYSITISNICTPLSALLPVLLPTYLLNKKFITISSFGWLFTSIYILIIALQSPNPFGINDNQSKEFWKFMIIIMSVSCTQLLTICKTCIYLSIKKSFMRKAHFLDHDTLEKGLSRMMEIVGIAVQVGSFCGAVTFFVLVNFLNIFQQ